MVRLMIRGVSSPTVQYALTNGLFEFHILSEWFTLQVLGYNYSARRKKHNILSFGANGRHNILYA